MMKVSHNVGRESHVHCEAAQSFASRFTDLVNTERSGKTQSSSKSVTSKVSYVRTYSNHSDASLNSEDRRAVRRTNNISFD